MKFLVTVVFTFFQLGVMAQNETYKKIPIQWVDHLSSDFSFAKNWSYPEEVYKNEFGQLSCDGICPEEVYSMMDSTGKIYQDSLEAFYKWVDTTHQYHTLQADAWCYEYAGANFIECTKSKNGKIECYTIGNAATHCILKIGFSDASKITYMRNFIYASILLNSMKGENAEFPLISGKIEIEKKSWDNGILKALFNFKFKNTIDAKKPIYWKGKILTTIRRK